MLELLLEELRACTKAAETARAATASTDTSKKRWAKWVNPLLSKASIVTGSVKDVAETSTYVKYALTSYGELIDFFKKS